MDTQALSIEHHKHKPTFFQQPPKQELINRLIGAKDNPEEMLTAIFDFFSTKKLGPTEFELSPKSYSRTVLYRDKTGFEIMIARWDKLARTPVHGHPGFALFYMIEGKLKETLFTKDNEVIVEELTTIHRTGDYTYHNGIEGRFDNAIHRISALEGSLSLHIYSDDALKGEVY